MRVDLRRVLALSLSGMRKSLSPLRGVFGMGFGYKLHVIAAPPSACWFRRSACSGPRPNFALFRSGFGLVSAFCLFRPLCLVPEFKLCMLAGFIRFVDHLFVRLRPVVCFQTLHAKLVPGPLPRPCLLVLVACFRLIKKLASMCPCVRGLCPLCSPIARCPLLAVGREGLIS